MGIQRRRKPLKLAQISEENAAVWLYGTSQYVHEEDLENIGPNAYLTRPPIVFMTKGLGSKWQS